MILLTSSWVEGVSFSGIRLIRLKSFSLIPHKLILDSRHPGPFTLVVL